VTNSVQGGPAAGPQRRSPDERLPGPHVSGKVTGVGHAIQKSGNIRYVEHLVYIDIHCYGGGWLTALEVGSGHYQLAGK